MASNIFSRLLPPDRGRSFYEDLRGRDDSVDVEDHAGVALDEENLNRPFHDYDLDQAEGLAVEGSQVSVSSATALGPRGHRDSRARGRMERRDKHAPNLGRRDPAARWLGAGAADEEADNDVPESLLVEHPPRAQQPVRNRPPPPLPPQSRPATVPGPSTRKTRAQWEATQNQQRLHRDDSMDGTGRGGQPQSLMAGVVNGSDYEKAMWRWVNVSNLDNFIRDVYDYYDGNGFWCIILLRVLHLVNVAFVAVFVTFLTQCVNYRKIPESKRLSQVLVPKCTQKMGTLWNVGLWMLVFYFIWKSIQCLLDIRRLMHLRDFYSSLLGIPEHDMQTVSWQDVVARIMLLRDQNPKTATNMTKVQRHWVGSQSKERLDAHDIANRLMRKENYLIALINKDVLDMTIPLPFLGKRQLLSRTLEWTIKFSILDFVFDSRGQVHQEFLKAGRRRQLSDKLRTRFMFAGFMNLALAPFLACFLVIVYFLTYFHEFRSDPSALGSRAYTPLAEWKFREFNEVPHLFADRLNMSHPFAKRYIDQFPKVKTENVAKTVAFMAGSIVAVLALATVFDSEMFLKFEITPDRTAMFYITVMGALWAAARGNISDDNDVFDPEYAMKSVIEFTHYEPDHWRKRLHSFDVKREFSELYKVKIAIFLEEIISILTTPLVLLLSLPKSSDQIIDFFREFTVHVDGLGYVCSFAVFDFKKGLENQQQASMDAADARDDYYSTKHGKMAASFYGFLDNYVINPKTGLPGHLPAGARHQPPPHFPGLYSPTLAAEMHMSRMGMGMGRDRGRSRAQGVISQSRPPQFRAAMAQPSPMASMLLDPHHQPPPSAFGTRSTHRQRHQRGGYPGERNVIEETVVESSGPPSESAKDGDGDEIYESGGALDESTWQTTPTRTLSRENSGINPEEEPQVGVLGLVFQQLQPHNNLRNGAIR